MNLKKKLVVITVFAIAMGLLETAVVIYLRELYYPGGFDFPLNPIPGSTALTEILREAATLIMLISIGIIAGKTFSQGFAWFLYSFAVWDIFFYLFLKILIDWPSSFLTWDILFLIPTTWTGPVIAPVLVSLTMIVLALVILLNAEKGNNTRISRIEWWLLVAGSLVLIFGFIFDYSRYMMEHVSLGEMFQMNNTEVMKTAFSYIPVQFPWWIFILGEGIIISGIIRLGFRIRKGTGQGRV